jgi:hypothetical protein
MSQSQVEAQFENKSDCPFRAQIPSSRLTERIEVRVARSKIYASGGLMFAIIGIAAMTRQDWLPGALVLLVAIGCGVRANQEWKRENT